MTLTWSAPQESNTEVERYAVSWSTANGGWGVASTGTSITLAAELFSSTGGLDTSYNFTVRADNDTRAVYSGTSEPVSATPSVAPAPEPEPEPEPQPTPPHIPEGAATVNEGSSVDIVAPEGQRIASVTAWYGDPNDGSRGLDVSSQLTQAFAGSTSATIESSNQFGDPAGGTPKILIVYVTYEAIPAEPEPQPNPQEPSTPVDPTPPGDSSNGGGTSEPVDPNPTTPTEPEQPVEPTPEPPTQPEQPVVPEPEQPVEPEPVSPNPPVEPEPEPEPETPEEPELETPTDPEEPDTPVDPEDPFEPDPDLEEPVDPVDPEPEILDEPETLEEPEPEQETEEPDLVDPTPELEPSPEDPTTEDEVASFIEDLLSDGDLNEEEKEAAIAALVDVFVDGVPTDLLEELGIDFEDLPPDTPIELENGVVITAEIADAFESLADPGELLSDLFSDPEKVLTALTNLGADMSEEVREDGQIIVVATILAGGIVLQAAGAAGLSGTGTGGGAPVGREGNTRARNPRRTPRK